ncbi:RCC1/BLIP-II [Rhizophagus irregularis]|nr:RCC1/BLIP-II [Rhizophagus irregularis]PKY22014.1 RCC1/BLIP-II [Rhizophagus irregularis]
MQQSNQPKRRGRPPKSALTVILPATESTLARQPRKRENRADHGKILRPKRRKGDTFTIPIPTRSQKIGRLYAIGSNELSQCGIEDSQVTEATKLSIISSLDNFNIVDISAGSLHNAALTVDGKVVTWGCNDHGALGRFTETPNSAGNKAILEAGNFDIGEEGKPAYAEGLDDANIVKIACGGNATFVISDQGHLYVAGTFKDKDGILGFSQDNRTEEPIFTQCKPFMYLTIVDIAAGEDHVLALTREGDVYAWGNDEAHRLGRKYSERRSLEPFNLGLKHIVRLYAGSYHNFAIDKNDQVWVFGFNNMGQCGLDTIRQAIIPPEKHSFFKGQKVEEFAVGQHHTLARMQSGNIYVFGRSDYGQLGLGDEVTKLQPKESKTRVVIPTIIPNLSSIKLIGTGDNFSMAVDDGNNIYAWGFGEYCVLGNETDDDVTSPFQIPNLNELEDKEIVRISCGSSHGLFLVS